MVVFRALKGGAPGFLWAPLLASSFIGRNKI